MFQYSMHRYHRRGTAIVATIVSLPLLLGVAAIAVDVGLLDSTRADLQNAADAASLAAVRNLPFDTAVHAEAINLASLNLPNSGQVLVDPDVQLGNWDSQNRTFSLGGVPMNAVRVTVRRSVANGNPLQLYFARIFGMNQSNVSATAIAAEDTCFDRGINAGRFVTIKELEFENVAGTYCINGRQGVTINEVEAGAESLYVGAVDPTTVAITGNPPGMQVIQSNVRPTRALGVSGLIAGIEAGSLVAPGTPVVVLSGPITLSPGDLAPGTAYVINGDATFTGSIVLNDVTLAVRGNLTFQNDLSLIRAAPLPGDLPMAVLATGDIHVHNLEVASGVSIIAGQDFIADDDLKSEPVGGISYGISIEAGRDINILDDFEFEDLNLNLSVPFGGSSLTLVM